MRGLLCQCVQLSFWFWLLDENQKSDSRHASKQASRQASDNEREKKLVQSILFKHSIYIYPIHD